METLQHTQTHTDTKRGLHLCGRLFKMLHGSSGAQPHQSVLLASDTAQC